MSLTSLFKGSDVATKVGLLLVHGSNIGQMPFHHQWLIYGYQWELNPGLLGASCRLNSEPWLFLFSVIQSTDYIKKNLCFHYAAVWGIGDVFFFNRMVHGQILVSCGLLHKMADFMLSRRRYTFPRCRATCASKATSSTCQPLLALTHRTALKLLVSNSSASPECCCVIVHVECTPSLSLSSYWLFVKVSRRYSIPFRALTLLVERQEGHLACKKLGVGLLMVTIWLELCTTCSSSCHHHLHHP